MRREDDAGDLGADTPLEPRKVDAPAALVREPVDQPLQARFVVFFLVRRELAQHAVDARLQRRRRVVGRLLCYVIECEPAVQQLIGDAPGLVEMVDARRQHRASRLVVCELRSALRQSLYGLPVTLGEQ